MCLQRTWGKKKPAGDPFVGRGNGGVGGGGGLL